MTDPGDVGDETVEGICNLFGSLAVATITQLRADIAQESAFEACIPSEALRLGQTHLHNRVSRECSFPLSEFIVLLGFTVMTNEIGREMQRNNWKNKHRAFFVACLCAGMSLLLKAESHSVENGKRAEIKGVIVSRSGDLVKIQERKSGELELVKLGDGTIIERERGLHSFFRHADMDVTALVPGLTIEAQGLGNAEGQLEATKITFNPDIFAVEIAEEQQIHANEEAAGHAQTTADQGVANAAVAQNLASQAQNSASQAKSTADQGVATATLAGAAAVAVNQRVSDLGDYVTVSEVQVYFPTDGSALDDDGKTALDELVTATSHAEGYLIEVAGYTSNTGSEEHNQKLSEDRAATVVHYLTEKDSVPMRRVVVPAGFGNTHPAADNTDKLGRALNRRVDVKVLVNKGLHEGE